MGSDSEEFARSMAESSAAAPSSTAAAPESWQTESAIYDVPARPSESSPGPGLQPTLPNTITLPRWVVYVQGGLLGVVATTFFLLGMMIGQNAGGSSERSAEMREFQLTGRVVYATGSTKAPDEGAVVIVVPKDGELTEADPQGLRPESFEPIDNPTIAQIESIGGRVVRINREGEFDLPLMGPREYFVLVISRNAERGPNEEIPMTDRAQLSGFFFAPDLIGEKKYHLSPIVLNRRSQKIPDVNF